MYQGQPGTGRDHVSWLWGPASVPSPWSPDACPVAPTLAQQTAGVALPMRLSAPLTGGVWPEVPPYVPGAAEKLDTAGSVPLTSDPCSW